MVWILYVYAGNKSHSTLYIVIGTIESKLDPHGLWSHVDLHWNIRQRKLFWSQIKYKATSSILGPTKRKDYSAIIKLMAFTYTTDDGAAR
jgi:hypothetical protein